MTTPANPTPEPTPLTDAHVSDESFALWLELKCDWGNADASPDARTARRTAIAGLRLAWNESADFARDLERQLSETRRRLAEVVKERDEEEAIRLASDPAEVLLCDSQARELEWIRRLAESEAKLTALRITADRRGLILADVLAMAEKSFRRDRGHVCESRKAVEAIAQTINARKDSGQDELTALRNAADGVVAASGSVCDRLDWVIQFLTEKPHKPWDNAEEWLKYAQPQLAEARQSLAAYAALTEGAGKETSL